MTAAFVSGSAAGGTVGGSSVSIAAPSSLTPGNLLVAVIYAGSNHTTDTFVTPTDWTKKASSVNNGNAGCAVVYTKMVSGLEAATPFSATGGLTGLCGAIMQFSAASSTLDGSISFNPVAGGGNPAVAPSVTPTLSTDVWVAAYGYFGGDPTSTTPTGMSAGPNAANTGNQSVYTFYKALSSTSATGTASSTSAYGDPYLGVSFLLEAAPATPMVSFSAANNAGTSVAVPAPASIAAGNTLVAVVYVADTTGAPFTPPSGWRRGPQSLVAASAGSMAVYTKTATGSEPSSYTFATGQTCCICAAIYQLHGGWGPLASAFTVDSTSSAGTCTAPAVTSPVAGAFVIAAYGSYAGVYFSLPAGLLYGAESRDAGSDSIFTFYEAGVAAGTVGSFASTPATSDPYTALTLVLGPSYAFLAAGSDTDYNQSLLGTNDGITWTAVANPSDTGPYVRNWASGYDGVGTWVTGGDGDNSTPTKVISYSTTAGATWTAVSSPFDGGECRAVRYVPALGLWIAAGNSTPGVGAWGNVSIITSPDGITWTARAAPTSITATASGYAVDWNGRLAVAVGTAYDGTNYHSVWTSPDGITWTYQASPFDANAQVVSSVVWEGTNWVAGATDYSALTTVIATSPDAVTWTTRANPFTAGSGSNAPVVAGLAAHGGRVIAVGAPRTTGVGPVNPAAITSTDHGVTWSALTTPFDGSPSSPYGKGLSIAWSDALSLWVAGMTYLNVLVEAIATSPNGTTWTARSSPWDALATSFSSGQVLGLPLPPLSSIPGRGGADGAAAVDTLWSLGPHQRVGFDGAVAADSVSSVYVPPSPYPTPTFVSGSAVAQTTFSVTIPRPASVAVGNLLVAFLYSATSGITAYAAPSGWTNRGSFTDNAPQGQCAVFTKTAVSADVSVANYTFTGVGYLSGAILQFHNAVVTGSVTDGAIGFNRPSAGSTTPHAAALTPSHRGDMLVAAFGSFNGSSFTASTPPAGSMSAGPSAQSFGNTSIYAFYAPWPNTVSTGNPTASQSAGAQYNAMSLLLSYSGLPPGVEPAPAVDSAVAFAAPVGAVYPRPALAGPGPSQTATAIGAAGIGGGVTQAMRITAWDCDVADEGSSKLTFTLALPPPGKAPTPPTLYFPQLIAQLQQDTANTAGAGASGGFGATDITSNDGTIVVTASGSAYDLSAHTPLSMTGAGKNNTVGELVQSGPFATADGTGASLVVGSAFTPGAVTLTPSNSGAMNLGNPVSTGGVNIYGGSGPFNVYTRGGPIVVNPNQSASGGTIQLVATASGSSIDVEATNLTLIGGNTSTTTGPSLGVYDRSNAGFGGIAIQSGGNGISMRTGSFGGVTGGGGPINMVPGWTTLSAPGSGNITMLELQPPGAVGAGSATYDTLWQTIGTMALISTGAGVGAAGANGLIQLKAGRLLDTYPGIIATSASAILLQAGTPSPGYPTYVKIDNSNATVTVQGQVNIQHPVGAGGSGSYINIGGTGRVIISSSYAASSDWPVRMLTDATAAAGGMLIGTTEAGWTPPPFASYPTIYGWLGIQLAISATAGIGWRLSQYSGTTGSGSNPVISVSIKFCSGNPNTSALASTNKGDLMIDVTTPGLWISRVAGSSSDWHEFQQI